MLNAEANSLNEPSYTENARGTDSSNLLCIGGLEIRDSIFHFSLFALRLIVAEIRLRIKAFYHVDFMEPSGPRLRANRRKQEILLALLRETREMQGLRQIDVAQRLDCPQTRVSKYELGTRRLDLLELRDVCRALGVSLVEFVKAFDSAVDAIESGPRDRKSRGRAKSE